MRYKHLLGKLSICFISSKRRVLIGSTSGKAQSVTLQTAKLSSTGKPYGHGSSEQIDIPKALTAAQVRDYRCAVPVSSLDLDWGYSSSTGKISVMPSVTCCPNVHKLSKRSEKGAIMDPTRSYAGYEVGRSYSQVLQAGTEKNKTQGWN